MGDERHYEGEPQTTGAHVSDARKGHETSDVELRPLIRIALILVGLAVFAHVAMWLAMRSFERDERAEDPIASPVAAARAVPPEPRLQPTVEYHDTLPHEDTIAMRRKNERILNNYGWVDREQGIAHIPIDVAMRRLLEQSGANASTTQAVTR